MAKRDRGPQPAESRRPATASGKSRGSRGPRRPPRAERRAARRARFGQVRQGFALARANDPKLVPLLAATALGTLAVMLALGFVLNHPVFYGVLGVLVAAAVTAIVFGRRVQTAAIGQIEGQPGAAAAVVQQMRGDWRVAPAVAFNRNQDLVHRVIGRPGVILIGEGSPHGVGQLLAAEKKKVQRVALDTPVYTFAVGTDGDAVPLRRLQARVAKLPRNLKPAQVREVDSRMKALGGTAMPIPKGPIPRSGRPPRGKAR